MQSTPPFEQGLIGQTLAGKYKLVEVQGGAITVAQGWEPGPKIDRGARWDARELGGAMEELLSRAAAPAKVWGT